MAQPGALLSKWIIVFFVASGFISCTNNNSDKITTDPVITPPVKKNQTSAPDFSSDSAYQFIKSQVDFGPRVPNTSAHEKCAGFMIQKLKSYGLTVDVQEGKVINYEGKTYKIKNILGSFHPENKSRIIFFTHWDSRAIADRDTFKTKEPIDGANDGASGVGVLMEIARALQKVSPTIGVDILFLDAEDTGQPNDVTMMQHKEDTWCLGSQYWSKNLPKNYFPKYGILLDMVGAKDAVFPMDGISMQFAPDIVKKVWSIANDLGYSKYFIYRQVGGLTDDHVYINNEAKIPTIDIIHYNPETSDFGNFHHRHSDDMKIIDKNTLQVVGQTLLQLIYSETP